MKTIGKSTSVLELTANRNDGAMRDVLVGYLCRTSLTAPSFWYDERKSTTERTLSAPEGLFHCRVT